MTAKPPYEIDVRKNLLDKDVLFIIDDERLMRKIVPEGLEEILNYEMFKLTFSEGAGEVVLEQSNLVYRLVSDQVRGIYRLFLYKKV